jgi:pimeloyl-ACP methyl ester carboxylesterase
MRLERDGVRLAGVDFALESLGLGPAIVVGQSLGGQTALLLAAERPDLVRGLVLADAGPAGVGDERAVEANVADLARSLARWPVPFASPEAAVAFFGGPSAGAEAWVDGLEHRDGGWWPRFDAEVMARTLREATRQSYWAHWERISCPVLVVRAGRGQLSAADARAMAERGQRVEVLDPARGRARRAPRRAGRVARRGRPLARCPPRRVRVRPRLPGGGAPRGRTRRSRRTGRPPR